MSPLRKQVDRIDQKILLLLQQRTKLAAQIGETKRQYGREVYSPGREHALLTRLIKDNPGPLPNRALVAIFREIISSSRAAQGQAPIGLLKKGAERLGTLARTQVGGSDDFLFFKSWTTLGDALSSGKIAFALLDLAGLWQALAQSRGAKNWTHRWRLAGELLIEPTAKAPLAKKLFLVTSLKMEPEAERIDRILILIECKFTTNAVKKSLNHMAPLSFQLEKENGAAATLLGLTASAAITSSQWEKVVNQLELDLESSVYSLGAYLRAESYGG